MADSINNRYEFLFLFDCENGNPNGDPDYGNAPRVDPYDMHGYLNDAAIKRRIRDYVSIAKGSEPPWSIFIASQTNLNTAIARAHEETGGLPDGKKATKSKVASARGWMCANYWDIRVFGGVLSTGANAGQVRGPVQIMLAKSVDPVHTLEIALTRVACTDNVPNAGSEEYLKWEAEQPESKLRTMGRKAFIPYGLFVGKGFISAHLARQTGFSKDDLRLLFEAILNMYEHDRTASKGMMTVRKLYVLKHVGTDTNAEQRERQAILGCCPGQTLSEEVVKVERKDGVEMARAFSDYRVNVIRDNVPEGVELLELPRDMGKL